MHVAQPGDHLEFDDDLVQEIGGIFANDHVVIKDDDSPLLDDVESALAHLVSKGVLVDLFNEPMTSALATLKVHPMIRSATGSNRRASPSSIRIPFIRLKRPVLAPVPTPDRAQMSNIANVNEP
jgi:hypothetical protein